MISLVAPRPSYQLSIFYPTIYLHGSNDCALCPAFVARPVAPTAIRLCPSHGDNVSTPRALHPWHDPRWQLPETVRSHCRREREREIRLESGKHMVHLPDYDLYLSSFCGLSCSCSSSGHLRYAGPLISVSPTPCRLPPKQQHSVRISPITANSWPEPGTHQHQHQQQQRQQ